MGNMELWLGPAGCGKTKKALQLLRAELDRDWQGVRYVVPTVTQKRSIEHLLLHDHERAGLLGDPITTFYNFAEEIALSAQLGGRHLSELQKHLYLKKLIRAATLDYFKEAARFPGFAAALGEVIDELKVQMVTPEKLIEASAMAREGGAETFANKLFELGTLYDSYQKQLHEKGLYDSEGTMWIAVRELDRNPELLPGLHCLILDGFARLTPIQTDFLRVLVPRAERVVVLGDYEEYRSATYHPVELTLARLDTVAAEHGLKISREQLERCPAPANALEFLRAELFRDRQHTCPVDASVGLLVGATPAQELELLARAVRKLLRAGRLADGTVVTVNDIAILARGADGLREPLARTFARYDLAIQRDPASLAHTGVGRALLATFRLVREGWKREDVLTLLKSGFLPHDPTLPGRVDIIARTQYLLERRVNWLRKWPDGDTAAPLAAALSPLMAFDDVYQQHKFDAVALMTALAALLGFFRTQAIVGDAPLPDVDPVGSRHYLELVATFDALEDLLEELKGLAATLGEFRHEELLDVITLALTRGAAPQAATPGIPVLSVHATGGEKFKVVFLCDMLEGSFPRHMRESAFLMDHERDEELPKLDISIEPRKHLEDDEQFWFLTALSTATHRLVFSTHLHDTGGSMLERSSFMDEVERILPELPGTATTSTFREVTPPVMQAENRAEYLEGTALGLRTAREGTAKEEVAAAYAACAERAELIALFRRSFTPPAELNNLEIQAQLHQRARSFSASELQNYLDCPFKWFASNCLALSEISEEYSALDRGIVLHGVLEGLFRAHQPNPGVPVNLSDFTLDELWPEVSKMLRELLEKEPRFHNRRQFLKDIETERLLRMLRRFLISELERARTRSVHPAFFELSFGRGHGKTVTIGGARVAGKIDRVDIADDNPTSALVTDYKTSASMTMKSLENGEHLQAIIYVEALPQLLPLTALGTEYLGLKQGEGKLVGHEDLKQLCSASKGICALNDEDWQTWRTNSIERIKTAVAGIHSAQIPLDPTATTCPETCGAFSLCRGDRNQLKRMVREGKGSA